MPYIFAYDKEILTDISNYKFQYPYYDQECNSYPYEFIEQLNVGVPANGWPARKQMMQFLGTDNYQKNLYMNLEFERSWVYKLLEDTLPRNKKQFKLKTVTDALNSSKKFIYPLSIRLWCFPDVKDVPAQTLINNPFKVALQKIIPAINKGQCCLLLQTTVLPLSPIKDISKIFTLQYLLKLAGIKSFSNVLLITSTEGNTENNQLLKIKTVFWEHFETSVILKRKENTNYNSKLQNCRTNSNFKRFLFLNHKERFHRVYLYYKLCTKITDFHSKFAASFCPGHPLFLDIYENKLNHKKFYNKFYKDFTQAFKKIRDPELPSWFTYPQSREEFCNKLLKTKNINTLSLTCNIAPWNEKTWRADVSSQWTLSSKLWESTGIYIGTETVISYKDKNEYLTLTEKTFKPIAMKSPFIIYGQPYILKKLKTYGYKTFDTLWDESYDTKVDLVERTNSIVATIEYLNNLTENDFYEVIKKSQEIVEYNYEHMMNNRYSEKNIFNALNTFYNNDL